MKLRIRQKLLFYVAGISLAAYIVIVGYILVKTQEKAVADARNIANLYAQGNANDSKAFLMHDLGIANAMAMDIQQYFGADDSLRSEVVQKLLAGVLEENERYYSTWVSLELNAIDPNWTKTHGRQRHTFFNDGTKTIDSLNLAHDDVGSLYYKIKLSKKEEITDPYYLNEYSSEGGLQEEILGSSICVPLIYKGEFAGIVGMDMALNIFDYITGNKPYKRASTFLLANNGDIVAHEDKELVSKNIADNLLNLDGERVEKIQQGEMFSFNTSLNGEEVYITFAPIKLGKSDLSWSMGTVVYVDDMTSEINNIIQFAIILSVAGLFLLLLILSLVLKRIIQPINQTSDILSELSTGNMDVDQEKLPVHRKDELGVMARSLQALISSLEQKVAFATSIGEDNLNVEIGEVGEKDKLGLALERMRKDLKENKEQAQLQNWFTTGIAEFSEVLRHTSADGNKEGDIYFTIIKKLVDYLNVNQGGIYQVIAEDNERYIELKGAYAYSKKKFLKKRIELGQGTVGQCVQEADTIHLKEIPKNFIKITSGLGEALPSSLLIVPLKLNDEVLAVVELASFKIFQQHEIAFVEKVGESIASFIFSTTINERTKRLLEESQASQEELRAAEEEMRQNIEELEATQEAMKRLHAEKGA